MCRSSLFWHRYKFTFFFFLFKKFEKAIALASSEPSAKEVFGFGGHETVVEETCSLLAITCINLIRAYDPNVIVLSGNLSLVTHLIPHVRRHIKSKQWTLYDDVVQVPLSIASCTQSNLQGAAALALFGQKRQTGSYDLRRARGEEDLQALYSVCLKTGDSGADGTHLFSDKSLLGKVRFYFVLLMFCKENLRFTSVLM